MPTTDSQKVKQRKKEFRDYAIPIFPIRLTYRIRINNQIYQLIGQQTTRSIIFTNYNVVDELGHEVPSDIRKKVFAYITKFQMTEQFISHIELIEQQSSALTDDEMEQLMIDPNNNVREKVEQLLSQNEQLVEKLKEIHEEIGRIAQDNPIWAVETFQHFDKLWNEINQIYKQRIPELMLFREFMLDKMIVDDSTPNGLKQLYEEAKLVYELFYQTIETDPVQLIDMNKFIELNGVLGYIEETVPEQNIFNQWEKLSYVFFKRLSYIIVLLGYVVLTIKNGFDIITTLYAAFFLSLSASFHLINNSSMLNKAFTQTKKQRDLRMAEHQQTREKFQQAYKGDPIEQIDEKPMEIKTVTARNSIIVTTLGSIALLYAALTDNHEETIEQTIALVGFVIIIIGLVLPKQTISKRDLVFKGNEITRGRQKIALENITKIASKRKGKKYEIYATHLPAPMKFRPPKTNAKQTKVQIKSWCERHLIEFE